MSDRAEDPQADIIPSQSVGKVKTDDEESRSATRSWLTASCLRLAKATLLVIGVLTVGICLSDMHWGLELFTHFSGQLLVSAAMASLASFSWNSSRWGWAGVLICAVLMGRLFPPLTAPRSSPSQRSSPFVNDELRIVLANVQAGAVGYGPLLDFIREHKPHLLVVVELSPGALEQLAPVLQDFPYRQQAVQRDAFGIGLYSTLPTSGAQQLFFDGVSPSLITRVELADERTMQVLATHPAPPIGQSWAQRRDESMRAVAQEAARVTEPLVVLGDLNCTPWSPHFKRLLRNGDLLDTGSVFQPSWPSHLPWPMRIPIDHVLVNEHWEVIERRLGPAYASDHLPVLVRLKLRAP